MDMLNKIKSVVISSLPGFPLSKEFEISNQIASGGGGMLWKIYVGVKRSTKQEASIFALEKAQLDVYSRRDRELILDVFKKGVSQLTRLRHPGILSVLHPLEETREMLAFATEPVFASLSNVLGDHHNLPPAVLRGLKKHQLYEVEIKYGLIQILEALTFLHKDVKMVHRNLCPQTIFINTGGSWKLGGFFCALACTNPQEQSAIYPYVEWDSCKPPVVQPNLDYLAPEYTFTMSCCTGSDIYSFAILFYNLFNDGKPLYSSSNQYNCYQSNMEELKKFRSQLGNVPDEMKEYVKLSLNSEPSVRPDAQQLSKLTYFTEDLGTVTLQYMDNLFQQDNLQKSQFFKGLTKVISRLPKRVCLQRILPGLTREAVNPTMIPFLLPNIFLIAEQATEREFMSLVFYHLIPIFKLQEPVQVPQLLLQNMMLILGKTPAPDTKAHVLPMIYRSLESTNVVIQELCLGIIPTFAGMLEFTSLRTCVIPRVKKIIFTTSTLAVRVNGLVCVGKLLEFMDKWSVQDDIIPFLPTIPSREPAILMSILGIYRVAFSHQKLGISKDILVTQVLPFILPLAFDNNLNLSQFNAFMSVTRDFLNHVESEQRSKLEQMNSLEGQQKTIEFSKLAAASDSIAEVKSDSMIDKFLSGVGLATFFGDKTVAGSGNATGGSSFETAPGIDVKSITNQSVSSNMDTQHIRNQPTAVSLGLEEKRKLAKQQEQQRLYKAQPELHPLTKSPDHDRKPAARDLTSTLIDRNISSMTSATHFQPSNASQQAFSSSNTLQQPIFRSNVVNTTPHPPAKSVDLSTFDSLLTMKSAETQSLHQLLTVKHNLQSPSQITSASYSSIFPTYDQPALSATNFSYSGQSPMIGQYGFVRGVHPSSNISGHMGYNSRFPVVSHQVNVFPGQMPIIQTNTHQSSLTVKDEQSSKLTQSDIDSLLG